VVFVSAKATIRTTLAVVGLCMLLHAVRPVLAQSPAAPVVLVSPVTIGRSGAGYRNPTIAVGPGGNVTVVAESGPAIGGRLAVADLLPIGWSPMATLDFSGPGDCCNPSMTYDSSGTLHIVWSEKRAGAYAIRYARRSPTGQWRDEGILSATPGLDCEFPQVAGDRSGRTWVTWQAGRATRYGIYLAWRDGDSSFTVYDVTGAKGDHHNLYPQLLPDSPYLLVWYEEIGMTFRLQSAIRAVSGSGFVIVPPLEFERLDANQMPWIFQSPSSGMLGGVWTDLIGHPVPRVRVFVGFQGASSQGEGLVADSTLTGDAVPPCCAVASGENSVAIAWTSRLATGPAVYVGRVDGASRVGPSLLLSVSSDDSFSRPRLAAGGGQVVHCVWFSDAARGGSGHIYYAALQF
jgi:hypothetical protein